jgi:hypothetical protein
VRVLLAVVLACCACKSTADASRQAWDKALARGGDPSRANGGGGGGGPARGTGNGETSQALAQFATDAAELLAGGSTTVTLPWLAERLCVEVPAALADDSKLGSVRCEPKTRLVALGHELQLDLGRASSISAIARELSDQDSAELVRDALQRLRSVCREPWTPARSADNALQEFHTCPTGTGAELAVGRFPHEVGSNQWQFSLAVLGPG